MNIEINCIDQNISVERKYLIENVLKPYYNIDPKTEFFYFRFNTSN